MTTNINIANTQVIELAKLTASKDNVRRVQSEAGLTELVASIKAHGLLQNLTVRANDKGKYEVVAGARRLAALRVLANEKGSGFTKRSLIPVLVLDAENDTEVSLAENTVRVNMHVADQVAAFRKLIEEDDMTPEQVGDRFGLSHMTVRRRVKLARVSPRIMDAFRQGEVTLQQMEAFAVVDDHGQQEDTFDAIPAYNRSESAIRQRLTSEKLKADHRLVRFIGLDAYRDAGGAITQDLFTEEGGQYLDDKPLVMKLVSEQLAAIATEAQAEGWKWAEYYLSESDIRERLPMIASFKREHMDEESAEVATIMAFIEDHEAAYEAGQMTEDEAADYEARLSRIDAIDAACMGYDPEEQALAGVRVSLDYQGDIVIRRGYLKPEDQHTLAARERTRRQAEAAAEAEQRGETYIPEPEPVRDAPTPDVADGYSQALTADLSIIRTAALAHEVGKRPEVALALIVHALAPRCLYQQPHYGGTGEQSCVRINAAKQMPCLTTPDPDNDAVFAALAEDRERMQAKLPSDRHDLLAWCLAAPQSSLLAVLAHCVGDQVDAFTANPQITTETADRVAEAVGLDMAAWWTPSEAFLKRISKKQIANAVTEASCAPEIASAILGAAKAEAILTALEALDGKGWTPPALRIRTQGHITQTQPDQAVGDDESDGSDDLPTHDAPVMEHIDPAFAGTESDAQAAA